MNSVAARVDEVPILGVDIDNVIADTDRKVRELIARFFGIQAEQSNITRWDYHLSLPITAAQERFVLSELHSRHILDLGVVPGAREALTDLVRNTRIWLVTSRPVATADTTTEWLFVHDIPYERLLFSSAKAEIAEELDMLIEDNLDTATEVAAIGHQVLLMDYPWNRDRRVVPNVVRVSGWQEALRMLHTWRANWRRYPESGVEYQTR